MASGDAGTALRCRNEVLAEDPGVVQSCACAVACGGDGVGGNADESRPPGRPALRGPKCARGQQDVLSGSVRQMTSGRLQMGTCRKCHCLSGDHHFTQGRLSISLVTSTPMTK
jgi:hypothetical protein